MRSAGGDEVRPAVGGHAGDEIEDGRPGVQGVFDIGQCSSRGSIFGQEKGPRSNALRVTRQ